MLTTFMVKDSFRDALNACPKITKKEFPILYKIKKTHGKNYGALTKINKQAFKRLMIFIARLHQAREICKQFQREVDEDWNNEHVIMCFECIEEHIQEIMPPTVYSEKRAVGKFIGVLNFNLF
jgi:hypothetical protein